jgi:hypothetical protein
VAVGAIFHFAVTATFAGIDIQMVGTIMMVIGVIGFAISLTGREHLDADLTAFPATNVVGDSSDEAYHEAERWLASGAKVLAQ